jgi:hypothetical protein
LTFGVRDAERRGWRAFARHDSVVRAFARHDGVVNGQGQIRDTAHFDVCRAARFGSQLKEAGTCAPASSHTSGQSRRYAATSTLITSRSAVITIPLVSGPRYTAITYTISDPTVPYSIGLAKPMC